DELLLLAAEPPEERLEPRLGPEILGPERTRRFSGVERAPAKDPALDQVRVDVAGLLDRKVSLVDRAVAPSAVAELLLQRRPREELDHTPGRLLVEGGIDAVPFQDREADLGERLAELDGEPLPVGRIAS